MAYKSYLLKIKKKESKRNAEEKYMKISKKKFILIFTLTMLRLFLHQPIQF